MVSYRNSSGNSHSQSMNPFFHRLASISSQFANSDQASTYSYSSSVNSSVMEDSRRARFGKFGNGDGETKESLSLVSRSLTASSVNSSSTANTTFDSNWLPNSEVVKPPTYKFSLKLTSREIEMLRWSWQIVTSTESRAGDDSSSIKSHGSSMNFNSADFTSFLFCVQFYNNLISMDNTIEEMIPSIRHQASAFAGVINYSIGTLEDLGKMKDTLLNLGKLHSRILGIDPPYFKTMGEAFMKTFRDWFGQDESTFPLEMEEAWIKLYCFLANSIIQGGIDPQIEYGQPTGSTTESSSVSQSRDSTIPTMVDAAALRSSGLTHEIAAAKQKALKSMSSMSAMARSSSAVSGAPAAPPIPANVAAASSSATAKRRGAGKAIRQSITGTKKGKKGLRGKGKNAEGDCVIM